MSGLIKGDLFPEFKSIAGYSEKFVPNYINKLIQLAQDSSNVAAELAKE